MPFAAAAEFSRDPQGGNPLGIKERRHASRLEPRGVARFLVLARETTRRVLRRRLFMEPDRVSFGAIRQSI
jgi:hypothetical protein